MRDVVLVVGACAPERREHARKISTARQATIAAGALPARHAPREAVAAGFDDLAATVHLLERHNPGGSVVIDLPLELPVTDAIGFVSDGSFAGELADVVCVVDAAHVLEDLFDDAYAVDLVARALLTVQQIEYASVILLTNAESLTGPELSAVSSLISHLAPTAHLAMDVDRWLGDDRRAHEAPEPGLRPGWIQQLNAAEPSARAPRVIDPRIAALRYHRIRPFHPARLRAALDDLGDGAAGQIIRSSGFARLATREHITAHWEQVGQMFDLLPIQRDDADAEESVSLGQDIVFTGFLLNAGELVRVLDAALLTDAEFLAGHAAWCQYEDPFPAWVQVHDAADD
ncbi:GTP-binding protein [Zhihengliuella flava]|uniref:G3E family GTPase n=1 Tax=Zhihengliuella flava TaxID=1285193 RepID=A0A931D758_9MICC|nr:GTP-binding protein [Zhihengliuella flava]MBG6084925.1 G3E family GTPase [Zhihengliuella flava]